MRLQLMLFPGTDSFPQHVTVDFTESDLILSDLCEPTSHEMLNSQF